jgi:hypothetical protein
MKENTLTFEFDHKYLYLGFALVKAKIGSKNHLFSYNSACGQRQSDLGGAK